MKIQELKNEIQQYQYFEDTNIIDVAIASVIATRMKLGDPVWLVIIGPSSGGKSQILRPLSLTDEKFMHRVDDLTENTLLSGQGEDMSLLHKIGTQGMIVISDLTVIFSKAKEARATILSQFRMVYDGEMTKYSGNKKDALKWHGYLGVISGSTPSIYGHFEEVSDMGERFIYYRMKDYDAQKATQLSLKRKVFGKDLDTKLSDMYAGYIKDVVEKTKGQEINLTDEEQNRIIDVAMFAEIVRTTAHVDMFDKKIDRIPVPAMPMRVALQLTAIAKALKAMRIAEGGDLGPKDLDIIDWCGYSLANEEKRACLRTLAKIPFNTTIKTQVVADQIGLATHFANTILQNLTAVGVLKRTGSGDGLFWQIAKEQDWTFVRKMEGIGQDSEFEDRDISSEETDEKSSSLDRELDEWGEPIQAQTF